MIYFDSCALVKLLVAEAETDALLRFISHHSSETHVTSALARVEVVRAVRHLGQGAVDSARDLLGHIDQLPITPPLLDAAAGIGRTVLRSLDAIHLASAIRLEDALTAFVSYDKRLADAAHGAGLPIVGPA
ncbi:MAG: type II toxin-antitoxin system VapC family toxin [Terriglobales bacterium]